ncbi:class I adenylate-forming enzyme family protein [Piscinibacter gummiphilus]|uniref:Fatty acid--CoA ligase n=1 Tax=Piscinibacter gummiphilus TaxID=946333 RepID=A0A1W6L4R9_9BURK|nr:class I adenylate-forming enzyme family protein [Piscinibacter gummiphilus]ARN19234.1 fatty acid--CoA ligase [Piscinibacter gummiphilus]ATU63899.1 fatty acid--CoA ligase [Piscinibacter gummiphilus]GLS93153.1 fatty acid--CoA ligase [Piscinibacter gummiphilus]
MTDPKPWPVMSIERAHELMTTPGSAFEIEERVIRGVPLRVWKNAPATMREVFLVGRSHGAATFLVYEDDRATFEGFARATLVLAERLQQQGVAKGDRVAIAMRNVPEWPVAYFAALLVGAIATPLNAWGTGNELEFGLSDSGAKVAIVDAERWDRIEPHLPQCPALERVFVARVKGSVSNPIATPLTDVIGPVNGWSDLPARPMPAVPLDPEDDATIFYTSGTTGRQKGALGTHRASISTVLASSFSAQRNFWRKGEPVPKPEDRKFQRAVLLAIPFFHTTGCQAILCAAVYGGTKIVCLHRWDVEQAMGLIERERCTQAGGVPTIAWQIIEHPERHRFDLSSLESVSYGGAPASPELVRRIKEVFPLSAPGLGWGMTETSATFSSHGGEDYVRKPDSSGPALPICDMKIADDAGNALPPGQVGELWARGPNVVKGYWNNPEATAATFVDGWVRTGDLGYMDEEAFLFIVDRKKDMLIRGGENIYCTEVEDALYAHPAVMDAGVVGRPHRTLGEEPVAAVTLKPGQSVSEAELRAFVGERLAAFKVPVRIHFNAGMLPRNVNGKLLKPEIKKLFPQEAA